jgi:riboflavin synthase
MFTGIIQVTSAILSVHADDAITRVSIRRPADWDLTVGESINVNGICSTVIAHDDESFQVEYMPETLRFTTVSDWAVGQDCNLERSLRLADRLSGHLVMGHVDAVGTVDAISQEGNSHVVTISHVQAFSRYVAAKGSIAVDGVSLTVINPELERFSVAIIPQTWQATTISRLRVDQHVNLEADPIAKYLEQLTAYGQA